MIDYSQEGEQDIILTYFKEKGSGTKKFLDIGAYDGKTFSNVLALIENGWTGVAIEGSPVNFTNLMNNYKGLPVQLICTLISVTHKPLQKFYETGDAISSTELEHIKQFGERETQEIVMSSVTLDTLASYLQNYYDFVNIDVEGYSVDLMEEAIKLFNPSLICVEYEGRMIDCMEIATRHNMRKIFSNGINVIFCR